MPTSTRLAPRSSHSSAPAAPGVNGDAAAFAAGIERGWDYAAAPESRSIGPKIAPKHNLYINGKFVAPWSVKRGGSAAKYFSTINPATEEVLSEVACAGSADVGAAVKAARAALPKWAALPAKERGKYLYRIARRIQERARELAVLETLDSGKPIRESRDVDVPLAAQHFFYHAGWADKLPFAFAGRTPKPVGVCGQIIPWNFPLLMAAWKLAPALACGNTCVLKPAETTPLTALRLAEIFEEVGLPPGVVNILTGDGSTGAALVDHEGVNKIAFTGSTEVGKKIALAVSGGTGLQTGARANGKHKSTGQETGATKAKRLTLELGGKSPHIIFDDAAIDQAVEGIIAGIFFNQGHVCCAGSRLLVQENILEEVTAKLALRMATIRVGDPMDKNTDLGAINSREQLDRIERYLSIGQDEGAVLRMPNAESAMPKKGFWCRPSFFEGVQPSHVVAREEIFGPVLSVMSFRTPDEAILRANNSPYGLAAGVWTQKGSKIFETARKLEAGVVWLNTYNRFDPASPFGGFKESGFGREGGMHGLRAYVEL